MENNELLTIMKELGDNRNELAGLYTLYNSSVLQAEEDRQNLTNYYSQLLDYKNSLTMISNDVYSTKKSERVTAIKTNKPKIKSLDKDLDDLVRDFDATYKSFKEALSPCGSYKTEYKHRASELCKRFKAIVGENPDETLKKGYNQQIKIIKAILGKIEVIISDYNVKKNKVDEIYYKFNEMYETVNSLKNKLNEIA